MSVSKIERDVLQTFERELEPLKLHVVHLNDNLPKVMGDGESPVYVTAWLGEPCTVASVLWDNGRLFTMSRVNTKLDQFCRHEGRFVALDRLYREIQRLKSQPVNTKPVVRRYGWFYFAQEWCGRDSLATMPMYAASQILFTQNRRKRRLPEQILDTGDRPG